MPECVRAAAQLLAQARDIEMGIGEIRIQGQGPIVVGHGGGGALRVLDRQRQVEVDNRIVGRPAERLSVQPDGPPGVSGLVRRCRRRSPGTR